MRIIWWWFNDYYALYICTWNTVDGLPAPPPVTMDRAVVEFKHNVKLHRVVTARHSLSVWNSPLYCTLWKLPLIAKNFVIAIESLNVLCLLGVVDGSAGQANRSVSSSQSNSLLVGNILKQRTRQQNTDPPQRSSSWRWSSSSARLHEASLQSVHRRQRRRERSGQSVNNCK